MTEKYQHGCHNWMPRFQRDSLWSFSTGKKSFAKTFSQLGRKFVLSCRNFPADLWKVHHCVQMNLLSKHIFFFGKKWSKIVVSFAEKKIVGLWQKNSKTSSSLRFHLSKESFPRGKIFLAKKQAICKLFWNFERIFLKAGKIYVPPTKKFQRGWKKMDAMFPQVFVKGNCLFFW